MSIIDIALCLAMLVFAGIVCLIVAEGLHHLFTSDYND
jgi:phosphotransferase system  glucose/maltose/N-acetylglucosamine-specific IIC component